MKKIYKLLPIIIFIGLNNCGELKKGLGFEKDIPDEFLIKKTDPIERPPNFELMPPNSKKNTNKLKGKVDNKNRAKSIIEGALKDNVSNNVPSNDRTSSFEKSILNQIEKK